LVFSVRQQFVNLGNFQFDPMCNWWRKIVTLPSFKQFKFREPGRNAGRSKIELFIEVPLEDSPSEEQIQVTLDVVKNEARLSAGAKQALFDDICGIGPQSGMWWHNSLSEVNEDIAELGPSSLGPLSAPEDLENLLGSPSICIKPSHYGYDEPCALLWFSALFEPEHGVGVLTDGIKVSGTGYQMSVRPFRT